MFDIGASELLVVGVVALVVIGPKELPGVLRTVGKTIANIRKMAGEFQTQFSDAMREAEMEEARKKVSELGDSVKSALDTDTPPVATAATPPSEGEINAATIAEIAPPLPEPAYAASHEALNAELRAASESSAQAETPAVATAPADESAPPKAAGHAGS
jgi:sec-independent protein translocase protein TatB